MTDYIERQAVIDIVRGYGERLNDHIGTPDDSEVYAYARGLILSIESNICGVPSVDVPRWIPVTEALPNTEDKVLCCTMTKKGVPGIVIGYYLRGEHGCSWACGMNSNVVAWMPLPEPYEGSKQ